MRNNPVIGFICTMMLFITGRVRFYKDSIDETIDRYTVFRHVKIKSSKHKPEAVFVIKFTPKDMGVEENIRFARLPMMIFMGFKGFSEKHWMVNKETGECKGIYKWQTLKDAENYSKSIAVRFMTKRSVEGSVVYEILPLKEYGDE
jgi:hypothetical protein